MAAKWETTDPELVTGDKSFMGELSAERISALFRDEWDKADEQKTDNPSAAAFSREIDLIGVRMGMLSHGTDFLIDNGAPQKIVDEYEASKWEGIARAAAKKLGLSDHRPLLVKATRTKEQEKIMADIAARESIMRLQVFLGSIYNKATVELMAVMMGELRLRTMDDLTRREDWDDISFALAFLVRYFFALHGSLRAEGVEYLDPVTPCPGDLPEEYAEELRGIMRALISYRAKHGGGFYENIAPCFRLDGVTEAPRQTEISQSKYLYSPTSLLWQKQREIATLGPRGGAYDVSRRGSSAPVWVTAIITDREGKNLDIDGIRKGAQMAIGNLIDQARAEGLTELTREGILNPPLEISVEQVYRRWAGLDSTANVTPQQAAEMEAAIDSLTSAPSQIKFEQQLEQHKHIKKQPDYDYDSPKAGGLEENLIMARKHWIETQRGERIMGYQILTYPLFFRYSHIVGQIAQVRRELLTGGAKPKEKQQNEAQNNSRDVAMRNHVAIRIERMKKDNNYSRKILLSEIAEDEGFTLTEKTERTLRKNLEQYLTRLQASNEIKSFSPVMGGRGNRKFVGFSLAL